MQSVSKFNLNGGLKRIVSTLICVMMVLATFPMHILKNTVSAAGGDPINLTLGETVQDGSEVSGWMNSTTDPKGALADADAVKSKGDINITLSDNITVTSDVGDDSLPTMTATTTDQNAVSYLFDFTDGRFAGKTITIDGTKQDKEENGTDYKITINNASLFFLNLQNCKVILKNIVIDGGWIKGDDTSITRSKSFINVAEPDGGKSSELEIEEGTTIKNCENFSSSGNAHGGAIYASGTLTINGGTISGCSSYSSASSPYSRGGAIYNNGGTLTINGGTISDCSSSSFSSLDSTTPPPSYSYGGGIYNASGTLTINGGTISGCSSSSADDTYGGAIYNNGGALTINGGTISGCSSSSSGNAHGGAIYSYGALNSSMEALTTINGGTISGCFASSARSLGGAIYASGTVTTINSGNITNCSVSANDGKGDAIYVNVSAKLYLPSSDFRSSDSPFLTITLPNGHDNVTCGHNTALQVEGLSDYVGIHNNGGTVKVNPNRKIEFFDSESNKPVGFVFGHVPENSQNVQETDWVSVPDSVPNRSGYKFALSYIKNTAKTSIEGVSDDGKFTLTQGMLDVANANKGVLRVYVNYVKLYTEQYFNHGEFVGIIRKKRA